MITSLDVIHQYKCLNIPALFLEVETNFKSIMLLQVEVKEEKLSYEVTLHFTFLSRLPQEQALTK